MENSSKSEFKLVEEDSSINPEDCFELKFDRQYLLY
jgi:hypothetical protein